jgi:hypothetical protein
MCSDFIFLCLSFIFLVFYPCWEPELFSQLNECYKELLVLFISLGGFCTYREILCIRLMLNLMNKWQTVTFQAFARK